MQIHKRETDVELYNCFSQLCYICIWCINNIDHSLLHNLDVYFLTSSLVQLLSKIINQIIKYKPRYFLLIFSLQYENET